MKILHTAAAALAVATCLTPSANAEILVGLTTRDSLITFDSAAPGTILNNATITGLVMGDTLIGIDRRPTKTAVNGTLYGLGVSSAGAGRLYTFNTMTGVATAGATLFADPADATAPFPFMSVMGSSFGFDFNPMVDRLRVTGNTGQNLRINVGTGAVQLDVSLAYLMGDPNFGATPDVTAVAYANNRGGALSTSLRGVDRSASNDRLVQFASANAGTLTTTAVALPFDSSAELGYDISGLSGVPFFSATVGNTSTLYAAGPGGVVSLGAIGGGLAIRDIAANVGTPVPEPGTIALGALGISAILLRRKLRKA